MSKSSKKHQRRFAASSEISRRRSEAEAASPLNRDEITELWNFVAEKMEKGGHDGTFRIAETWLKQRGIATAPVLDFLRSQRVGNDFDIILSCDPNKLFGPSTDRLALMPIPKSALLNLLRSVDQQCREHGCDHTQRFAKRWLRDNQFPISTTAMALLAQGGGCDCEIVLNVDLESIYPPTQKSPE